MTNHTTPKRVDGRPKRASEAADRIRRHQERQGQTPQQGQGRGKRHA